MKLEPERISRKRDRAGGFARAGLGVGALLFVTMSLSGCASTGGLFKQAHWSDAIPPGDYLSVVSIDPASPAALTRDERMRVEIRCRVDSVDAAVVLVRPYTKGRQTPGYIAHAPLAQTNGVGELTGWFSFRGPATVDEIRVSLVDASRTQRLLDITNRVVASWK